MIVRAILSMARSLEITTVAECVETEAQLTVLREEGCHVFQGYFYGPPVALGVIEQLVRLPTAVAPAPAQPRAAGPRRLTAAVARRLRREATPDRVPSKLPARRSAGRARPCAGRGRRGCGCGGWGA